MLEAHIIGLNFIDSALKYIMFLISGHHIKDCVLAYAFGYCHYIIKRYVCSFLERYCIRGAGLGSLLAIALRAASAGVRDISLAFLVPIEHVGT